MKFTDSINFKLANSTEKKSSFTRLFFILFYTNFLGAFSYILFQITYAHRHIYLYTLQNCLNITEDKKHVT